MCLSQLAVLLLKLGTFSAGFSQSLLDSLHLLLQHKVSSPGTRQLLVLLLLVLHALVVTLQEGFNLFWACYVRQFSPCFGKSYVLESPRLFQRLFALCGQLSFGGLQLSVCCLQISQSLLALSFETSELDLILARLVLLSFGAGPMA